MKPNSLKHTESSSPDRNCTNHMNVDELISVPFEKSNRRGQGFY